jgi:hypothetical protein
VPEQKPPKRTRLEKLSGEYHKARKEVMLWAGILFIWELIGIDLDKARNAGGNVGAIISAIKSPQAVPWVLLVLVGYFLFKLWIEWNQCEEDRRRNFHSRLDFLSAWIVAFAAFSLYLYQAVRGIQIADKATIAFTTGRIWPSMLGISIGAFLFYSLWLLIRLRRSSKLIESRPVRIAILGGLSLCIVVSAPMMWYWDSFTAFRVLSAFGTGVVISALIVFLPPTRHKLLALIKRRVRGQ